MLATYPPEPPRTRARLAREHPGKGLCMDEPREREQTSEGPPENRPEEPGAEGGANSPAADQLPGAPADDDSPVGDTDQHSKA
jgi:hypothetical protein